MSRVNAFWIVWILLFGVVLVLPTLALLQATESYGFWYVGGYVFFISLVTFGMYSSDKKRAGTGAWRISEGRLHLLELAGGWAAGFWAQRMLRHKIVKTSYQLGFWVIVLLHQYVSYDYLRNWHYSLELFTYAKKAYALVQPYLE